MHSTEQRKQSNEVWTESIPADGVWYARRPRAHRTVKSLMEDSGYTRSEAVAISRAELVAPAYVEVVLPNGLSTRWNGEWAVVQNAAKVRIWPAASPIVWRASW